MPERALVMAHKVSDMNIGLPSVVAMTLTCAHEWGDEMP
jgi:hypothetical protein